ncbi:hypothetical protein FD28_GL001994 [Levilactobacillus hammesii DSM 16381]|uniref:Uncharacterized protein n=1 Tax=Levilactobacillus hammesii DSM 16381 TaxID=1423753 RepID=A0A0R1UWX1_9LACO|nr:hypothetical protein FD28_GL001994 [Levilactobacillus hammesii DSM 16381]
MDGGYVLFSRLKVHRKISKMPAITKTAYWLPTPDDDFWKMPEGTLGSNRAIHYGRTYALPHNLRCPNADNHEATALPLL